MDRKINGRRVDFQISGMHCQSCELLIKDELASVPGLKNISVNYKTGQASITTTNGKATDLAIINAIKKAGYETSLMPIPTTFTFPKEIQLEGMISKDEDGQLKIKGKLFFSEKENMTSVPNQISTNNKSERTSVHPHGTREADDAEFCWSEFDDIFTKLK